MERVAVRLEVGLYEAIQWYEYQLFAVLLEDAVLRGLDDARRKDSDVLLLLQGVLLAHRRYVCYRNLAFEEGLLRRGRPVTKEGANLTVDAGHDALLLLAVLHQALEVIHRRRRHGADEVRALVLARAPTRLLRLAGDAALLLRVHQCLLLFEFKLALLHGVNMSVQNSLNLPFHRSSRQLGLLLVGLQGCPEHARRRRQLRQPPLVHPDIALPRLPDTRRIKLHDALRSRRTVADIGNLGVLLINNIHLSEM